MKPFKTKRRYKRRIITYKNLFLATLIIMTCYMWYEACDEISVNTNNNVTSEVK